MRKSYLTLFLVLCTFFSFADNEQVCVITNQGSSGEACSASSLGYVDPCSSRTFKVNYTIPAGYVIVAQYEWFVNNVSVKTTTDPTDFGLPWQFTSATTTVYCKVTYKKQDGTLSQPFTSNSFTPNIKSTNFGSIALTTATPAYGCTNTVSFSLNTTTCSGQFCDHIYTVGQYNITWQPPGGWTQTSISNNGSNVSFTPDATTGGTLTATIQLPCGFTETRTFNVTRSTVAPSFSVAPGEICTSTSGFSISPVCGAVDYTYTITGASGITFAANGQQSLTTSSTSVNINLSGAATAFVVKVKTNYAGGVSSADRNAFSFYGVPSVDLVTFTNYNGDPYFCTSHINNQFEYVLSAMPDNGGIEYRILDWPNLNVVYTHPNPVAIGSPVPVGSNFTPGYYVVEVRLLTDCGVSDWAGFEVEFVNCSQMRSAGYFNLQVSPNPASTDLFVTITREKPEVKALKPSARVTYILYDLNRTRAVKQWTFANDQKQHKLNVSGVKPGQYILVANKGKYQQSTQVLIK